MLHAFLAPGAHELFQVLCRSTCPFTQRSSDSDLPGGSCPHSQALRDMAERWAASFRDLYGGCRAWLEHMRSETLYAVEFSTHSTSQAPGGGECVLEAVAALDAACADGLKAKGVLVVAGGQKKVMSPVWEQGVGFDATPLQHLQEDCEVPILMLDVGPGEQLQILRSMAQLLSQGRVFGILTRLHNPYHWPAADDPLAVYEFLAWHGYLLGPLDDLDRTFTAVGTVQLEVASADAVSDLLAVAFPRSLRPAARFVSDPEITDSFASALRSSCVAAQRHKPNSWVEVDTRQLLQKVQQLTVQLSSLPQQRRRISALLPSDALGHDSLLAGLTLAASLHVATLFVENVAVALQLASKMGIPTGRTKAPEIVLLHQPPQINLCSLVNAGVAIAVQSFRWILASHRCRRPVKIHLEIDTGIGRTGLRPGIALGAVYFVLQHPRFSLRSMYTKLCCVRDLVLTGNALRQMSRLEARAEALLHGSGRARQVAIQVGGGLARLDAAPVAAALPPHWWVRVGQGLFGDPVLGNLAPLAMTWKTTVSSTSFFPENTRMGYCPQGADCDNRTRILTLFSTATHFTPGCFLLLRVSFLHRFSLYQDGLLGLKTPTMNPIKGLFKGL